MGPVSQSGRIILSSNDANDIQLGLGGRATFFGLAGPGSEVRVDASIGQVAGVDGEFYKPLIPGKRFFVAPRAYYAHTVTSFFSGSQQLAQYTEEKNGFGVDLGYQFGSKAELRIGEDYQWYGESLRLERRSSRHFTSHLWSAMCGFNILGRIASQVPTRGTEIRTQYNYLHTETE